LLAETRCACQDGSWLTCNLYRLMPVKAPGRQLWGPSWQACSSSWTPAKMLFITFKEIWLPWRPIISRYAIFVLCISSPSFHCRCLFWLLVSVVWCPVNINIWMRVNPALQPCQCLHSATLPCKHKHMNACKSSIAALSVFALCYFDPVVWACQ